MTRKMGILNDQRGERVQEGSGKNPGTDKTARGKSAHEAPAPRTEQPPRRSDSQACKRDTRFFAREIFVPRSAVGESATILSQLEPGQAGARRLRPCTEI